MEYYEAHNDKFASQYSSVNRYGQLISPNLLFAASLLVVARTAGADAIANDFVIVHAQVIAHSLYAYGQIEPIAVIQVRAVNPGTLSGLRVVPGSAVTEGEVLARIGGPRMESLLTTRAQTLRSAHSREEAASRALEIVQHQLALKLATRQAVNSAQSELAAARAAARTAEAQLREVQDLRTLRAPAAGTVIEVQATDGEQTTAGQTLLTLQPAGKLWLRAAFYGADAARLHVGMTGRFQPSGEGDAIPVSIVAVSSSIATDGGLDVGLVPTSAAPPRWWISGQWGTVTLAEPSRSMIEVPTQALILDRGRWWVLVHTDHGNKPQEVVPGPAHGWQTAITSGLQPGQQVVVTNAFLEYHRGIAHSYTAPD